MRIGTVGYVFKQGFKSFSRNKMFSLACVATMSACIFLFGLFFSIALNMQHFVRTAEEGVAITIFFDEGTTDAQRDHIEQQLLARPDVAKVQYVTAEEAWESFRYEYFGDNPELAEGFRGVNPLAESDHFLVFMSTDDSDGDSMVVRSRNLSATQTELVQFAESMDGVRRVNRSDVLANTLSSVNMLVGYVSAAIIIILFGVSIFLINNTVTTGITVRKEEIAIMKYIGAKDFVVRAPFVLEGLIIGILGAVIPLGLLYFLYSMAVEYIITRFYILTNIISFLDVNLVYRYLLPVGLLLGVGIGFLGSYITVRKHLKV